MENTTGERNFLKMPVVILFASQLLAGGFIYFAILPTLSSFNIAVPALPFMLAFQGALAAVLGYYMGLARWWALLQVVLPFAAFYSLYLQVPVWIWLVFFGVAFLVYRNSARSGVPLYLSNSTTWAALVDLLPQEQGIRVADLGGGLGGTALYLGKHRPDAEITSIESAPIPALISKIRKSLSRLDHVEMQMGDFWGEDLGKYRVVYAFLSPVPMKKLYEKVRAEMKPGSLFISNSFEVPDVEADETRELSDRRRTRLHIWRL